MIVNASSKRATRWSYGNPNARNSVSFQPAPRPSTSRPPAISSTVAGVLGEHRRVVEAVARDERPERDPARGRGERGEHRPRLPWPAGRPDRRSGRAGARRPRSRRTRRPRSARAIVDAARASGPRARPRAAGRRRRWAGRAFGEASSNGSAPDDDGPRASDAAYDEAAAVQEVIEAVGTPQAAVRVSIRARDARIRRRAARGSSQRAPGARRAVYRRVREGQETQVPAITGRRGTAEIGDGL